MRYPELVPSWVCNTPIRITIEGEGVDEDGAPPMLLDYTGKCNWQDGGKTVYTADQKVVDISGRAFFNGDICPSLSNITGGEGEIFGEKREIHQGFKRRNPDGTVNHTEIEFK